jgi:hypothetical protein
MMKHLFTKTAIALSTIILLSGIILIRAMTTTDTQTIIEDISTAKDQMMDMDEGTPSTEQEMVGTTVMQEIAEPELAGELAEEPEMIEDLSMTADESQVGDEDIPAEEMSMEDTMETMADESEPTQDADDIMIEEEIGEE